MSPTISTLMQCPVRSVGLDETVQAVEAQMAAHGLTWLPVREGDTTIVGVISASDLLRFHADGKDAAQVRAWQLCGHRPIVVDPATPAAEVARRMVELGIHHVVVADAGGLRGVVSSLDFVRTFANAPAAAPRS